ncbi:MAG: hypothetical protein Q8O90_02890 [Elusimicrobiota bacterium]|nr:hypothetical protein [Elusimicrobiota bacterium]
MNLHKNIFLSAALALNGAAPLFAGPVAYREAAAPWSSEQAAKVVPVITAEFLKEVKKDFGAGAAAGLSEKKEKVSALLGRFRDCALNSGDLETAEKYFTPDFKEEVRFFAGAGCAEFKASAEGRAAAPRSVSLDGLRDLSASGALATSEGSARFFDGAKSGGAEAVQVKGGWSGYQAGRQAVLNAPSSRPLSSNVPALRSESQEQGSVKTERPANLGKDGRVNQALEHWNALRRQNWEAYKKGDLAGAEKAKALMKAAAGAGFGGILYYSNLPNVEIAAARLGWDVGSGAGAGTVAWSATKLVFHSGVFVLALAPIPLLKVAKAALAGEGWAVAVMGAMAAGPVNRYVLRIL